MCRSAVVACGHAVAHQSLALSGNVPAAFVMPAFVWHVPAAWCKSQSMGGEMLCRHGVVAYEVPSACVCCGIGQQTVVIVWSSTCKLRELGLVAKNHHPET